jgi:hypothetical protein
MTLWEKGKEQMSGGCGAWSKVIHQSSTAPRGKENVRGVFYEVKGTCGACRCLGE